VQQPARPPAQQAAAPRAQQADYSGVQGAKDDARKKAAARSGRNSTILTGGMGLEEGPYTKRKTVLGA